MANKVKVTAELKAQAEKIAKELGVKSLFTNTKGEFFTIENHALLSEKGAADSVHEFTGLGTEESGADESGDNSEEKAAAKKELTKAKAALTVATKQLDKADEAGKADAQAKVDVAQAAVDAAQEAFDKFDE